MVVRKSRRVRVRSRFGAVGGQDGVDRTAPSRRCHRDQLCQRWKNGHSARTTEGAVRGGLTEETEYPDCPADHVRSRTIAADILQSKYVVSGPGISYVAISTEGVVVRETGPRTYGNETANSIEDGVCGTSFTNGERRDFRSGLSIRVNRTRTIFGSTLRLTGLERDRRGGRRRWSGFDVGTQSSFRRGITRRPGPATRRDDPSRRLRPRAAVRRGERA